jgi:nucleotide-binding universal stress UspA family protein
MGARLAPLVHATCRHTGADGLGSEGMFERLVVAYDGSKPAGAAAELAFELARRRGARLTLAYVLELPGRYPELPKVATRIERAEEDWRRRLATLAAGAPDGASVETEVLVANKAGPALLELLRERHAEVLVGGTHGVGGFKRTLLGSVSQQLLEHAPCSVLLVRDRPRVDAPRTVVAGVDGSGATPAVLAMAGRAAAILSAQLVLAHAADELIPSFASTDQEHALRAWAREQGQRILDEARAGVAAPLEEVTEDLREGRATDELVALCNERRPVLVVVGNRGLHGFKGLLLGSTARHLVNHAPCPVLIVKTATNEEAR